MMDIVSERIKELTESTEAGNELNEMLAGEYYELGIILQLMFRYQEAIDACRQGLKACPNHPDLLRQTEEIKTAARKLGVELRNDQ